MNVAVIELVNAALVAAGAGVRSGTPSALASESATEDDSLSVSVSFVATFVCVVTNPEGHSTISESTLVVVWPKPNNTGPTL